MHFIFTIPAKALHMIWNSASSVIIVSILAILALTFIEEKGSIRKAFKSVESHYHKDGRKGLWKLIWLLWTVVLLHVTIIGRSIDYNPLSQLFTGWVIVKSGDVWNFDPLYNILMFIPYTLFLLLGFPRVTKGARGSNELSGPDGSKGASSKEIIERAVKISFLTSLFIETTQLRICLKINA